MPLGKETNSGCISLSSLQKPSIAPVCLQNKDILLRVTFQAPHSLVIFLTLFPNAVQPMISSNSYFCLLYMPVPLHGRLWLIVVAVPRRTWHSLSTNWALLQRIRTMFPGWLSSQIPPLLHFSGSQVFFHHPYSTPGLHASPCLHVCKYQSSLGTARRHGLCFVYL